MLATMLATGMAIVPASGILFEIIATGNLPLICYFTENQKKYSIILPHRQTGVRRCCP